MVGSPQYANANGNINGILEACLINGFNIKTATSASAIGGVLTLNFASSPGFEVLQTVEVAVADVALVNGQHRVVTNASNQVTIAIPGLPDGAVGSSGAGITVKQAGAGWSKPFSDSTKAVFRPPAGNRRFLRVTQAVGADIQVRGYVDMTDVDTGTEPFPTIAQAATSFGPRNINQGAAVNSPWFAIVTDKWFIFSLANAVVPTNVVGTLFFGDSAGATVPGDAYHTVIRNSDAWYFARNYLSDGTGARQAGSRESDGSSGTWPSLNVDGVQFLPYVPLVEVTTNILRGVPPNLYKSYPQIPPTRFLDIYSNITGIIGRMKPISFTPGGSLLSAVAVDEEAWL